MFCLVFCLTLVLKCSYCASSVFMHLLWLLSVFCKFPERLITISFNPWPRISRDKFHRQVAKMKTKNRKLKNYQNTKRSLSSKSTVSDRRRQFWFNLFSSSFRFDISRKLFLTAPRLKGIEQCRLLNPGSLFLWNKSYWISMVLT